MSCSCRNHTININKVPLIKVIKQPAVKELFGVSIGSCSGQMLETVKHCFNNFGNISNVQFFVGTSSTDWNVPWVSSIEQDQVVDFCLEHQKTFYLHCPLSLNLSRNDRTGNMMLNSVQKHCNLVSDMPASCVLHIGNGKQGGTIHDVAKNINRLDIERGRFNKHSLLLENCAGQGNDLGKNLEEIRHLYEGFDKTKIGMCIDTQHLFSSGWCDFSDSNAVDKLWEDLDGVFGKPQLIHLNDSKVAFNQKKDRHEVLRAGYIWYNNYDSLMRLRELCRDDQIELTLETPYKLEGSHRFDDFKVLNYPLQN